MDIDADGLRRIRKAAALALGCVAVGLGSCGDGEEGSDDATPHVVDPSLIRVTLEGSPSEEASLRFSLDRDGETAVYVNAAVDLDGDGTLASYEVGGRVQEEWLVQNALVLTAASESAAYVVLVDPGLVPGLRRDARFAVSDTPLPGPWDGTARGTKSFLEQTIELGVEDRPILVAPFQGAIGGAGGLEGVAQDGDSPSGPGMPGDRLQTGPGGQGEVLRRDGMTDVTQQPNTCVGHSIANSLSWLARRCGFEARFRQDVATTSGVDEIAIEILEAYGEIDGLFFNERGVFGGVRVEKQVILDGKVRYSREKGLPVTTEILSRPDGEFRFEDLAQKMKDGCDVELTVIMLDPDTDRPLGFAHNVTLAGYATGPGGKSFTFHDPGTGEHADVHRLRESARGGLTFPYVFEGKESRALVEFALVECCATGPTPTPSPTATPTATPPPSPTPTATPTSTPTPTPTPSPSPTPTATPEPTPEPTPTAPPAFGDDNCCEFARPQGCASGPDLTLALCRAQRGFLAYFPGQTCNLSTGKCFDPSAPAPTPTPTPTSVDPGETPTPTPKPGATPECEEVEGEWALENTSTDNPGQHPIPNPLGLHAVTVNSPITITGGAANFVPVSGQVQRSGPGACSFTATGRGTVAGFPDVSVAMDGVFSGDQASGSYAMGVGGELPGGQAIRFDFVGVRH